MTKTMKYSIESAGNVSRYSDRRGKPRVIVDGVMHPAGKQPIRFKSLEAAMRHLSNIHKEPVLLSNGG